MKKTIFIILAMFAYQFGFSQKAAEAKNPKIFVESTIIDYGIIKKGSDGVRKYKVYNKGNMPLIITQCTPSCSCTAPDCPKEPILPGEFKLFSVSYNTTHVGVFSKSVSIISNDPNQPGLTITIKGEVKE